MDVSNYIVKPDQILVNTGGRFSKSHGQLWCRVEESDSTIGEYATVQTSAGTLVLCELVEFMENGRGGFENRPIKLSDLPTISILMPPSDHE